jgi:hypothetical protein
MALMEGVAGLFGWARTTDSQKAQIRQELNVMDAINAHVRWKVRLQAYLNGTSTEELDPAVICRDDQCALGKWIHGPALKHFEGNETFHQLRTDHAEFHLIAGDVVNHVQANERPAAEALMDNEYKYASRRVVQALTELDQHVNG